MRGPAPQEAERFADAWDEFVLAIRRAQSRTPQSEELTLAQYYLLLPLDPSGALPVSRLAELAAISAPTATRFLDGLERAGLVRRERSNADRRTVLVSLTQAGRKRMKRKYRRLVDRRRRLYQRLAPEEREQSERLLRHLAELIAQL